MSFLFIICWLPEVSSRLNWSATSHFLKQICQILCVLASRMWRFAASLCRMWLNLNLNCCSDKPGRYIGRCCCCFSQFKAYKIDVYEPQPVWVGRSHTVVHSRLLPALVHLCLHLHFTWGSYLQQRVDCHPVTVQPNDSPGDYFLDCDAVVKCQGYRDVSRPLIFRCIQWKTSKWSQWRGWNQSIMSEHFSWF